jgi:hypothetical protein
MKLIYTFSFLFIVQLILAQTPKGFKYQAVVRDNLGNVLVNKIVSIKSSILEGSITGSSIYEEKQTLATNDYGVVNLTIGQGTNISGNFNTISWGNNLYFLKTELDVTGGNNFQFMGTSQLMSVPYALYADKSGSSKNDLDTSATNEIQNLSLNGQTLSISNGNSVTVPDNQQLTLNGNSLSISNGNSINLPPDNDGDTTNEIQSLSFNGGVLSISKSNSVTIPDNQQLSISGQTLTISNGNNVTVPDNQTLSLNANNLSISGGNTIVLPPDSDANPINEIQAISLVNDTLYLSNGGFVNMLPFKDNTDNQQLSINGNQLQISGGNSVTITGAVDLDPDPTNELQYLNRSGDTLFLSKGNFVIMPHDDDSDPTNEIQTLTITQDSIKLSGGGGNLALPTPTNAIVPIGTCLNSLNKVPPLGYTFSGNTFISGSGTVKLLKDTVIQDNCSGLTFVSDSSFIYAVGGGKILKFDPNSNEWNLLKTLNYTRYYSSTCMINGTIYIAGGTAGIASVTVLNYLEAYNINSDNLSILRSSPVNFNNQSGTGNMARSVIEFNNSIYFIGGTILKYDISSNTWSNLISAGDVYKPKLIKDHNNIYILGGNTSTSNSASKVSKYNVLTNQLTTSTFNVNGLIQSSTDGYIINDTIYLLSGTSLYVLDTLFTPSSNKLIYSLTNSYSIQTIKSNNIIIKDNIIYYISHSGIMINLIENIDYKIKSTYSGSTYSDVFTIGNRYFVIGVSTKNSAYDWITPLEVKIPIQYYIHCVE